MVGKILGWVKANLLVVIFTVVTVVMLPGAFIASQQWNTKIQSTAKAEFDKLDRELDGASRETYSLPAVFGGEQTISQTRAPNAAVTSFFKTKREDRTRQVSAVVESAVDRNEGEHEVLMPELLPNQADPRRRERLSDDFAKMILGEGNQASVYKRMLDRINAGEPVDPGEIAAVVGDYSQQETERMLNPGASTSGTAPAMTAEQSEALSERLVQRRLWVLNQRASDVSVFAGPEAILAPAGDPSVSQAPLTGIAKVPAEDLYRWQWDLWVVEDILGAVARANTDATGPTGVPDSVVKRIDRILVQRPNFKVAGDVSEDEDSGGYSSPSGTPGGGLWSGSHTGRLEASPDGMDVRMVRLELVVSTERLPRLFQALGEQNFMTVTSVKLQDYDAWEDLKQGYYYGPEHVSKAVIDVETVWLREWTKHAMPDELREKLGIARVDEAANGEDEG
ncbi:MAG: hypothetical protein ACI89L_002539 [Phycisphaerales bacterium]|jgi:hypothetical protein